MQPFTLKKFNLLPPFLSKEPCTDDNMLTKFSYNTDVIFEKLSRFIS
jgi:hypothetical protein